MPKGSRMMSTKDKFAGFPWLERYCQRYLKTSAPTPDSLRDRITTLEGYITTSQRELDEVVNEKMGIEARREMGPTLRMVFQRAEAQLMHDIKEHKKDRDEVHNALLELPWYEKKQKEQLEEERQRQDEEEGDDTEPEEF